MLVLRCTQKLLDRLKRADNLPAVESTTRLGDWYGNVLRIGRSQHLLFISERERVWARDSEVTLRGSEVRTLATRVAGGVDAIPRTDADPPAGRRAVDRPDARLFERT